MTDKELKRLNRKDLLQIMIMQQKKVDSLNAELKEAKEELERRRILSENAGSIAEASLRLNQVFENAQKAADMYLENISLMNEGVKQDCLKQCLNTRSKCRELLQSTRERILNIILESQEELDPKYVISTEFEQLMLEIEKFEL